MTHRSPNFEKAFAALEAYRDRGHEACLMLEQGREEDAVAQVLRTRDAAFHNFCALDACCQSQGLDIALDPKAQGLWLEIQAINGMLAGLLEAAKAEAMLQLKRVRNGEAATQRYGASQRHAGSLRKSI